MSTYMYTCLKVIPNKLMMYKVDNICKCTLNLTIVLYGSIVDGDSKSVNHYNTLTLSLNGYKMAHVSSTLISLYIWSRTWEWAYLTRIISTGRLRMIIITIIGTWCPKDHYNQCNIILHLLNGLVIFQVLQFWEVIANLWIFNFWPFCQLWN